MSEQQQAGQGEIADLSESGDEEAWQDFLTAGYGELAEHLIDECGIPPGLRMKLCAALQRAGEAHEIEELKQYCLEQDRPGFKQIVSLEKLTRKVAELYSILRQEQPELAARFRQRLSRELSSDVGRPVSMSQFRGSSESSVATIAARLQHRGVLYVLEPEVLLQALPQALASVGRGLQRPRSAPEKNQALKAFVACLREFWLAHMTTGFYDAFVEEFEDEFDADRATLRPHNAATRFVLAAIQGLVDRDVSPSVCRAVMRAVNAAAPNPSGS